MPQVLYQQPTLNDAIVNGDGPNLAIGRFLTAWGEVEGAYMAAFINLSGLKLNHLSFYLDRVRTREMLDLTLDLCAQYEDRRIAEAITPLIERASALSAKRNQIVHAGWGMLDGEPALFYHQLTQQNLLEIMQGTQRGLAKHRRLIFTVAEINEASAEAISIRDGLMPLVQQLMQISARQQNECAILRVENANLRRELLQARIQLDPQALG